MTATERGKNLPLFLSLELLFADELARIIRHRKNVFKGIFFILAHRRKRKK